MKFWDWEQRERSRDDADQMTVANVLYMRRKRLNFPLFRGEEKTLWNFSFLRLKYHISIKKKKHQTWKIVIISRIQLLDITNVKKKKTIISFSSFSEFHRLAFVSSGSNALWRNVFHLLSFEKDENKRKWLNSNTIFPWERKS